MSADSTPSHDAGRGVEARLAGVGVGTVVQNLERQGFPNCFMRGVGPVTPNRRFVGRARTLRTVPVRPDVAAARRNAGSAANPHRIAIDEIGPGEVLVVDARGNLNAGVLGDVFAARIKAAGGVAVVTDGCVRDSPEIAEVGLPVFAGAVHAATFTTQHLGMDVNVPIGCGGVLVMPGDILVGDPEGVAVIPAELAEKIADLAVAQEELDVFIREKVEAGVPLARAYPPDVELQAEYRAWQARRRSSGSRPA